MGDHYYENNPQAIIDQLMAKTAEVYKGHIPEMFAKYELGKAQGRFDQDFDSIDNGFWKNHKIPDNEKPLYAATLEFHYLQHKYLSDQKDGLDSEMGAFCTHLGTGLKKEQLIKAFEEREPMPYGGLHPLLETAFKKIKGASLEDDGGVQPKKLAQGEVTVGVPYLRDQKFKTATDEPPAPVEALPVPESRFIPPQMTC